MGMRAYPDGTLAQEIPFVHHQHVKHDLQHAGFEYFGGGLDLREEELERVESHPLEIESVPCVGGWREGLRVQ
jgi:hypothetical protein